MNDRISTPWIPAWIPHSGHALRHAGIHFDAVRIKGAAGSRVASELMVRTAFEAGAIVQEATGERYMYFLLPPETVRAYEWPPGVRALTRGRRTVSYVGVPALTGATWPLGWRSVPTAERFFVVGKLLEEVAGRLLVAGAVK
ncbi:hypothetical protein AQI88_34845 [Streptomyces cellostaticus]|uniref:Uncharacterized protein n=1 Tax=Streptomyces cellostaticus TaxID=67285 RepID=A0A101NFA1_9ACTN|nr:hypothetical protein [Streptomyces cellostaticus]KUM91964.1 hypothetical protein AQI88_34845 [Streptomyces cellostaticus]GHI06879.1 hypothetical protein Scel_52000 [Streptomyces cellostaticus]